MRRSLELLPAAALVVYFVTLGSLDVLGIYPEQVSVLKATTLMVVGSASDVLGVLIFILCIVAAPIYGLVQIWRKFGP